MYLSRVLAFVLEKVAEKMLRDRDVKFTGERVFSLFKQMGAAVMKVGEELYAWTSEPTWTQRKILKTLKIQPPPRVIMEVK